MNRLILETLLLLLEAESFFLHAPIFTKRSQYISPALRLSDRTSRMGVVLFSQRQDDIPAISLMDKDEDENGRTKDLDERHIPVSGISVNDEMEAAQRDQFVTEVVSIEGLPGVAQLVTNPVVQYAFEPVRYLVALNPPNISEFSFEEDDKGNADTLSIAKLVYENVTFAMIDVPPFSPQLVTRMKSFMGVNHKLTAILVTSSDAIHNDEAPTEMYSINRRGNLLEQWKEAFPDVAIVTYRLDTPRDCRTIVTQRLDGNGPFAWDSDTKKFVETGRPLRRQEWDQGTANSVLSGSVSPDEAVAAMKDYIHADGDEYGPEAIRAKEKGRQILAVCTPGHSYGTLSFVFPEIGVCCSGYTIPIENTRNDEGGDEDGPQHKYLNFGAGPALDVRGYITTSRAGISRQMESARLLVDNYVDRFRHVLPSRGDPFMFAERSKPAERHEILMAIIDQYDKIGKIYEQLGITSSESSNDDDDD